MYTPIRSILISAALLSVACGEDAGQGADGGTTADADTTSCSLEGTGTDDLVLAGGCDQESLLGTVVLEVQGDFSFLDAKVANAVLPTSIRAEEMTMGGCRLMRKSFPFCDPICESDEACNLDGECVPYPKPQDLGDICVAGLEQSYVLTAEEPGYHYFNTQLSHPAFAGGERIELRTTGGAYDAFEMAGVGVTPMNANEEQWNIVEGEDLVIGWETSDSDAHTSVYLSVNIDQHGTSPLLLECELPDTGAATVPSALIEGLTTSGISGFPVGKLVRRTADSVAVSDGCIDLIVRSPATIDVRVAGHTPCTMQGQCPNGQTCNLQLETCE